MTRHTNPDSVEKEARLQQAIAAYRNKEKTASGAIRDFNVPHRTFYKRLGGIPPRNLAHEKEQLLTHIQERELVRWITRLTITGYPPRYATLIEMADIIRRKRDPETLAPTTNLTNFPTIGTQWIQRFLRRHPELSAIRPRNIDASRIKDTSPERLSKWFADLEKVMEEYDVSPENMYNMDESGFTYWRS